MTRKRNNASKPNQGRNGEEHAEPESSSRTTALETSTSEPTNSSTNTTPVASGTNTPTSDSASDSWVDKDGNPRHLPKKIVLERTSLKRPSLAGSKVFGSHGGLSRSTSYKLKAPGTPFDELDLSEVPWLVGDDPASKGIFRYRRLFLILGIFLGAVLAWGVSQHSSMEHHVANFKSMVDEQLTGLGIDISHLDLSIRIPTEYADLGDKLFSNTREWLTTKDFQVGRRLSAKGYQAEHPVILLPGIISTGLESWSTNQDSSGNFRKRLWGTSTMFRMVVLEKEMWIKQLSLDPDTGLDPPGIKVRAAEGLDAASYFVTGYWIWSKIIENLAAIGYDTNNLYLASFDWRLSYHNLEVRDHFFTRLKLQIEQNSILHKKKTVLVAHSMGSSVAMYFMKWVEAEGPGFGNGGPTWVEDHLESFTSIAGTFLGVPKTMAALLSGEMRDTVELPPAGAYLLEKFFSRAERARLFRTWAGSASMVIKGGESVWGNQTWAPDDDEDQTESHGKIYSFKSPQPAKDQKDDGLNLDHHRHQQQNNLTADEAVTYLLQHSPTSFQKMMESNYSNGIERDEKQLELNDQDPTKWANPLEARLPNAPNLKIYCMYGVGKSTERSYWYEQGVFQRAETEAEGENAQCNDDGECQTKTPALAFPLGRNNRIDSSIHNETSNPTVRAGCKMADGDGTVSLLSLGAMCEEGWKRKRYNPGGAKVVTHELLHEPDSLDLRGGESTGDHVDLLGSRRINEYVLKVAAGKGDEIERNVVSRIQEFAKKIKWDSD